jgi:TolB-like protein/class 3 adenylate cyclase
MMTRARKLTVVMFTDIMGYTRMLQYNEEEGLQLGAYYRDTLMTTAGLYHGKVLKHYGDGSLTIFESIIEAIQCGKALQKKFQQKPLVPLRMGIHLGDLAIESDDVYGDGVNIASRLESVGVPGSVIFSTRVKEELEHHPDLPFTSLGTFHLKNVKKPLDIFALTDPDLVIPTRKQILESPKVVQGKNLSKKLTSWQFYLLVLTVAAISIWGFNQLNVKNSLPVVHKSIAVLPFVDMSQLGDQEWFCDGMTEQITSNLVRLSGLKVISRTSAMKYKGVQKSASEIGKELNVSHILEGSVRKSNDKIRITAQLINVEDEYHLWERDFDKEPSDFFEIQDEVSTSIAEALYVQIADGKGDKNQSGNFAAPTRNMEALRNYQLGKQYYDLYDSWASADYLTSLNYFDAAISADSSYSDAYVGKANLLLSAAWRKQINRDSVKFIIEQSIDKAIQLDPSSGIPYVAKGYVYFLYDFDFDRAEEMYDKAIELAPNYDVVYARYFWLELDRGNFANARSMAEKAYELNPLNSGYYSFKGEAYWAEMKLDSAIITYRKNLELFPNDPYNTWGMACSYGWGGKYDTAIEMINSIPFYKDNNFASAYFSVMKGDTIYAQKVLDNLLMVHQQNPNSWTWDIAAVYAVMGEKEKAMNYLESDPVDFIHVAHWYKPLRDYPRFKKLLEKLGFDPDHYVN